MYMDDEYQTRYEQAQNCHNLFFHILTPIAIIIISISIICCKWTIKDENQLKFTIGLSNNEIKNTIPPCIELTGKESHDKKRYDEFKLYVKNQKEHLLSCYKLFVASIWCLCLWSFAMFMIFDDSDEAFGGNGQGYGYANGQNGGGGNNNNNNDDEKDLFEFKFQSLGAINFLGEVGQNANLYYSCWISMILSIALVYEMACITYKQFVSTKNLESELGLISKHMVSHTKEIEMIMTWSKAQQNLVKVRRSTWHESLHKLRFRAGFWLVVLIASLVIYCSASRVWRNYIYPQALANDEIDDDGMICTIKDGFEARDDMGLLHPSLCQRTKASQLTGIICIALSLAALGAHYHFYRLIGKEMEASSIILRQRENKAQLFEKKRKLMPLRLEFFLAFALTMILAYNAIFVTAVEGPGSKVGNLYYSSWISFVTSMLITLGCLEDILDQEDEEVILDEIDTQDGRNNLSRWMSVRPINEHISTRLIMLPSSHESGSGDEMPIGCFMGGMPIPTPNSFHQILEERLEGGEEEGSRSSRLHRWASIFVFSSLYLISALDAAFHISYGQLDFVQGSMVACPCIIVSFCFVMTCLCVFDFNIVNQFYVGGVTSIFLSMVWFLCVILTLHKESSWAVNEIAEIENANLYYFTWATVVNIGMLSSSYLKQHFKLKPKGLMIVLWLAVVKICFVMFGSCVDILFTVRDQCKVAEEGDEINIFCQRTFAGAIFGFLGMAAGFFAAIYRFFFPSPSINSLIGESIMSSILTIMFAFSLAMVTGIGGPGQAVGDLYYGSWLAFFAALGVTGSLYTEVMKKQIQESLLVSSDSPTVCGCDDGEVNAWTPYSFWDAATGKSEGKVLV